MKTSFYTKESLSTNRQEVETTPLIVSKYGLKSSSRINWEKV